jgi:hypothetical protein
MSETIPCAVCGAEGERSLTVALPCGHYTIEDTFGPMPVLRVPSVEDVFRFDAPLVKKARDTAGRVEGVLRAHAEKIRDDYPTLWQAQIAGGSWARAAHTRSGTSHPGRT